MESDNCDWCVLNNPQRINKGRVKCGNKRTSRDYPHYSIKISQKTEKSPGDLRRQTAITQECWEQYWTSPGGKTLQDTNYTATCLPSQKLYKLDEPDTQDTAGEARTNSSVMYSYGPPHMAKQKQDDQLEHTYSSYVRIWDVALKTCQKRWMIGRSGERGSGISVLAAQHDDDECWSEKVSKDWNKSESR